MRAPVRSSVLDAAIPVALSLTVVAFACGSSSVGALNRAGKDARWAMLFLLLGLAAVECGRRDAWPRLRPYAGALGLLGLALLSAVWSVEPRLTVERAISLGVLFAAALLVVSVATAGRVLGGLLAGAAVVAVAGLLLLLVDHTAAVQEGSTGVPTRLRGLGESANTAALLFGVALPLAVWLVIRGPRTRHRVAGAAAVLVFDGSIVAAGSRGALVGGFAGAVVVVLLATPAWRARGVYAAAAAALFVASFFIATIPKPLSHNPTVQRVLPPTHPKPGYIDANRVFPLNDDVGRSVPGTTGETFVPRQAFGSSGRTQAWRGALHQAAQRPVAGYGFGTENDVFVNRYHLFAGGVPENSYIGLLLQIGIVGLGAFLALVAGWLWRAVRTVPRLGASERLALAAAAGVVTAALVTALVQSYVVSVGNIAAATLWIAVFLVRRLATQETGRRLR